jgi:hypothetical protein
MTCISPWNSTGLNTRAGTLITPRHIVFASHYEISEGATIRFITDDNQVVNRTMLKKIRRDNFPSDITVGVLNEDVPSSISFCKVLPSNFSDYLPTGISLIGALGLDQQERATVIDMRAFATDLITFDYPVNTNKSVLYFGKFSGDSGNPAFLIINNELILLTVWTYGNAGAGTFLSLYIDLINQMIADVDVLASNGGTGYTLSTADLSGFTNYL